MARWIVASLIALNLILGAAVVMRFGEKSARADVGRPNAPIASVAGQSNGNTIVYILDTSSGNLYALKTDIINRQVQRVSAIRNVTADMARIK